MSLEINFGKPTKSDQLNQHKIRCDKNKVDKKTKSVGDTTPWHNILDSIQFEILATAKPVLIQSLRARVNGNPLRVAIELLNSYIVFDFFLQKEAYKLSTNKISNCIKGFFEIWFQTILPNRNLSQPTSRHAYT